MGEESSDPMIGSLAGPFRVVRKIGEGGMGAVYLAERDSGFQQTVAVKFLLDGPRSEESEARFRIERQVLAALRHPNIVRLLDGGVTSGGVPFLAMDYVEGVPIDRYCAERNLSTAERVKLVDSVLEALEYAHRQLLLHCDLKPANILVTDSGRPMLLDFGVAKLLDPSVLGLDGVTRATRRPFTPEYASPEQLRNAPLGTATDTYSIGLVLWTALTGSYPFESLREHPVAMVRACLEQTPELASRRGGSELRGDLDAILAKALRKEPEQRYRTATEFRDDLRRYLENLPVLARQGSRRYAFAKFVRRNREMAAAAGIVLAIAATAGTATVWQGWRAERSRVQAEARFADLRKLTNALLTDHYEALNRLPGSTRALQSLVSWSSQYLAQLEARAGGDPTLRLELAQGYKAVSDNLGVGHANNLGKPKEALVYIDKGLTALRDFPPNAANHRTAARLEAELWVSRSSAHTLLTDTASALEDARNAAETAERTAGRYPRDMQVLVDVANAYHRYADSHGTSSTGYSDPEKARSLYEHATVFAERARKVDPSHPLPMRALAILSTQTGDIVADWNPAAALPYYDKALRAADELPPEARKLRNNLRMASLSRRAKALALQRLGKWDEAAAIYREVLPLFETAYRADPANQRAIWDFASHLKDLADVELGRGNKTAAVPLLERAIAVLQPYAEGDMLDVYQSIGDAMVKLGIARCPAGACRDESLKALSLLARGLDAPGADPAPWENSAWALLHVEPASLRDPARALALLDRSARSYRLPPPQHYEIRTEALERLGRREEAARVAAEGLARMGALAPGQAESRLRKKLRSIVERAR